MNVRLLLLLAMLAVVLSACSDDPVPGLEDGLPATCHPFRVSGICASPFPASHYLSEDDTTATGFRLALTADHFPKSDAGEPYDPTEANLRDGFPATSHILVVFGERLDAAQLPTVSAPESSVTDASPTLLINADTGERVMHFAELDGRVSDPAHAQALIIRPLARLPHGAQLVVGIRRHLTTASGAPATSPVGYTKPEPAVAAVLEADGTSPDDLLLAWDFVTASRESTTRDLATMVEATLDGLPAEGLGYTITGVDEPYSSTVVRRVRGTFTVPRFVSHTDLDRPEIEMLRNDAGLPVAEGTYEAPFVMLVPASATAQNPARLSIYGHGFVNTAAGAFGEADDERFPQRFGDSHGHAFIGTDWWGLSAHESASGAIPAAVGDLNAIPWLAIRLQQAVVNNVVLARAAKAIAADPAVNGGEALIDNSEVDYLGLSLGGIMGSVLLAYSPDLQRAILHLGAASWSTILQRSKLWGLFSLFLDPAYEVPLAQVQLVSALQLAFDAIDGLTLAPELTSRGRVLVQMGVHDDSVSNVATMMLARTMGLSVLDDSPLDIPAIDVTSDSVDSALTVFDTGQPAPPSDNRGNAPSNPNDIHDALRDVPAVQTQMDTFFRTGTVVSTCDGVCDPE